MGGDYKVAVSCPQSFVFQQPRSNQLGWFARLRTLFGLQPSVEAAEVATSSSVHEVGHSITSSLIQPQITPLQSSSMHTSAAKLVAARVPMIKFIGARLPRPNYNRSAMPSIPIAGSSAGSSLSGGPAKATSIGPVGKIPRGQGIEESALPLRFQRPLIDMEEVDAINSGGATAYDKPEPAKAKK